MRSYDVDGRVYPCQFFMPLSVGEDKAQKANEIVFPSEEIPKELLDDKCRSCIVRAACPNCFGANYAATGSIYQRDDNMCRLTKIIMKARSYFRAKQWEFGQLHETEDDLQTLLRAIIHIQDEYARLKKDEKDCLSHWGQLDPLEKQLTLTYMQALTDAKDAREPEH